MKKYLFKVLVLLCAIIAIDRLFIVFKYNDLNLFNEVSRNKLLKIKNKISDDQNYNILIFGSSHAQFGVAPHILMKGGGIKVLNLAFGGGANVSSQVKVLKKYLSAKDRKPDYIFYGIDVFALNFSPSVTDFSQSILLNDNGIFRSYLEQKQIYSYIYMYSHFIPDYYKDCLNGVYELPYLRDSIKYNLEMFSKYDGYEVSDLGFVSGFGLMNPLFYRYKNTKFSPNAESIVQLRTFIDICVRNNIKLLFFQTPEYIGSSLNDLKYDHFKEFMMKLIAEKEIEYFDYNNKLRFPIHDSTLFFDTDHLNRKGAELFSHKLYSDLLVGKECH